MSRRGGSKGPRRGRHEPNRSATRLHAVPSPGPGADPGSDPAPEDLLLREIRDALRSDDPTAVAVLVSSLLSVTSDWADDPVASLDDFFDDDDDIPVAIPVSMLVESFIGISYAETTAAHTVMEPRLTDDLEAAKVRRVLAARRHPMPEYSPGSATSRSRTRATSATSSATGTTSSSVCTGPAPEA